MEGEHLGGRVRCAWRNGMGGGRAGPGRRSVHCHGHASKGERLSKRDAQRPAPPFCATHACLPAPAHQRAEALRQQQQSEAQRGQQVGVLSGRHACGAAGEAWLGGTLGRSLSGRPRWSHMRHSSTPISGEAACIEVISQARRQQADTRQQLHSRQQL